MIHKDQFITFNRTIPQLADIVPNWLTIYARGQTLHLSLDETFFSKNAYVQKCQLVLEAETRVAIKSADLEIKSETPFYLWRFDTNGILEYYGAYTYYYLSNAKVNLGMRNMEKYNQIMSKS